MSYGLTRFNENTLVDERRIEEAFALIRTRGYSTDEEESTPGGSCFSVAISLAPSKVEAAMSLSMPTTRLPQDPGQQKHIVHALQQAAEEVSKKLARLDRAQPESR
jgi:DNA-binding IclR family transcriptional regulator